MHFFRYLFYHLLAIRTDDTDVKYQLAARMEAHIVALIVDKCITQECGIEFIVDFLLAVFKEEFANAIQAEAAREFIDVNRLDVVIPEDLANAIQAEANSCVDDRRASLALEAEGVTWSDFTPEPTDSNNRNYSEDRTELGDDLNS